MANPDAGNDAKAYSNDGHAPEHKEPTVNADTEPQRSKETQYYPLFAPQVTDARKEYFFIMSVMLVMTILFMWAFLPIYWASLAYSAQHSHSLRAWVIDRDGSAIGQGIRMAVQISSQNPVSLGWEVIDASDASVADEASVIKSIVDEKAWLALVVNSGATANLINARSNGDSNYNASNAISVYYAQARNELASGNFLVPVTTALLTAATTRIAANLTAQFLAAVGSNATAIEAVARAPQTVANPVGWTMFNLRPYNASVATAVTLVGMIYLCIFAFIITMANFGARQRLAQVLTMRSYLLMRIVVPMILYLPLSLSLSIINLPFKLPFGAKYSHAGGFFLYWFISYLTMAALGLSTEAMVTLLTPKFIAFFLLALIISNVSVTSLPYDLQPGLYQYGYGWPVSNASQAIRTIIFNTKSHLGRNIGVLIAWTVLSIITTILFTYLEARRDRKKKTE